MFVLLTIVAFESLTGPPSINPSLGFHLTCHMTCYKIYVISVVAHMSKLCYNCRTEKTGLCRSPKWPNRCQLRSKMVLPNRVQYFVFDLALFCLSGWNILCLYLFQDKLLAKIDDKDTSRPVQPATPTAITEEEVYC